MDGTGKTRLCKTLSDDLSLEVAYTTTPRFKMSEVGVRARVFHGIADMLKGRKYIHDRLYFSELVYGSVIRKSLMFTPEEQRWIEDTLEHFNVPIVICKPPLEKARDNALLVPQMSGVAQYYDQLYLVYTKMHVRFRVYYYDYTRETDHELMLDWIKPILHDQERMLHATSD